MSLLVYFAYLFSLVFFITNTLGLTRKSIDNFVPDILTAVGNGLFLLAWIYFAAPKEWQSLIMVGWMLIFAVGAFLVLKATGRKEPFFAYGGVGVALLAAATAVELSGSVLAVALTLECMIVALAVYLIDRNTSLVGRVGLLVVGPLLLSLEYFDRYSYSNTLIDDSFSVLFVVVVALFFIGNLSLDAIRRSGEKSFLPSLYFWAGSIQLYTLLWFMMPKIVGQADMAVAACLFLYTIIGLIAYFYGQFNQNKAIRTYGAVLLGFVVLRLLLIDVWKLELVGRIVAFFGIGILLMGTAFVGRRQIANKQ
jgi:hypothetical protein